MDYWDETMQDDVYLVTASGWVEAAEPRALGKRAEDAPDLTVQRMKYRMDLLPPDLVKARFFSEERDEVARLQSEEEMAESSWQAFLEENSGEDSLLDGAMSEAGKVTQATANARLREIRNHEEHAEEREAIQAALDLMKAHAAAKKATKAAQEKLDAKVLDRYAALDAEEVAELVVRDKWMASLERAVSGQVERLTTGLVDRVTELHARYAESLPELERRVEELEARVASHLRDMGIAG